MRFPKQKMSTAKKRANDNAYGRMMLDYIDNYGNNAVSDATHRDRLRANYRLYNGHLDKRDFTYLLRPYGDDVGELPADLRHYDISSYRINSLLGEEERMPLEYRVMATSEFATTQQERERRDLLRQFVQQAVMKEMQEQGLQLQQEPPEAMAPPEIEEYLQRTFSDARQRMGSQLLDYSIRRNRLKQVLNKGYKHALLSGIEAYYVGIRRGEPYVEVVNPVFFDYDKDPDNDFIHKGQWCKYEMRMTPASVVDSFGDMLKPKDIERLYSRDGMGKGKGFQLAQLEDIDWVEDWLDGNYTERTDSYVRVLHCEWVSLLKIGFLTFYDENGDEQELVVPETYKLDREAGDVDIRWEWIPEVWEGYKIESDIYVGIRPKPNQHKNLDNLYDYSLGYFGVVHNNDNAQVTSMMDRMKPYQYLYDIVMYRLELALKSDKGKKLLMDINQIPKSLGVDVDKWLYYMDAMDIVFVNPYEEGNRRMSGNQHTFNTFTTLDMSMAKSIQEMVGLLEYCDRRCAEVSGVSAQRQGDIGQYETASAARQAVVQSSYVTGVASALHNAVKREVLQGLLETAKVAYSDKPLKVKYVLDDMSVQMLTIDPEQLSEEEYNVFVTNAVRDLQTLEDMRVLASQMGTREGAELDEIAKILSATSLSELISASREGRRQRQAAAAQNAQIEAQQDQLKQAGEVDKMEREYDRKERLEHIKGDYDLRKAEIDSFKFQKDQDVNDNQVPDQLEIEKLRHQKEMDKAKLAEQKRVNDEKLKLDKQKADAQAAAAKQKAKQTPKK